MCGGGQACVRLRYWVTLAVLEPFVVLAAATCCVNLVNACVSTLVHSVQSPSVRTAPLAACTRNPVLYEYSA